jgi:hypothetical protein
LVLWSSSLLVCSSSFEAWSSSLLVSSSSMADCRFSLVCARRRPPALARLHRLERDQQVGRGPVTAADPLEGDLVGAWSFPVGQADVAVDDRGRLDEGSLEAAHQHHLQLGVDQLEDIQSLAPVAVVQERPGAAEGVNQLGAFVDQQAGRHDPFEERVVSAEELGE